MIRLVIVTTDQWERTEEHPAGEFSTREEALAALPGIAAEYESDTAWLQVVDHPDGIKGGEWVNDEKFALTMDGDWVPESEIPTE